MFFKIRLSDRILRNPSQSADATLLLIVTHWACVEGWYSQNEGGKLLFNKGVVFLSQQVLGDKQP